ncbi:alpha/beta hydrolase [Qipengyuania sp. 1NDH17]|uniref:Alpha/beta hydrolase n=1 Tax=Qipengyuania polymorpha TaxID=2867234 RepID=A0ABS7IX17_9SPHN|nr:alpha/beta hydrolase [Qipengyuania polymorpha]MBX7457544.1 alpha/beta hydrolase [Qipengyuania polymorpha]
MRWRGKQAILATASMVLLASCTATDPTPPDIFLPPVTFSEPFTPPQVAALPASEPVLVENYAEQSAEQVGMLRLPEGEGSFPVAMLVHGGCWRDFGSPADFGPIADWLAANGVASWSVGYREIGSGGEWPNLFIDLATALKHIGSLAERYPLDTNRISVIGHSAGAAAPLLLSMEEPASEIGMEGLPEVVSAAVLDAPVLLGAFAQQDMSGLCSETSLPAVMGGLPGVVPDNYAMLDAAAEGVSVERFLIVEAVEPLPGAAVVEALRAKGAIVETISLTQKRHFDMLVPGTTDFALIAPALLRVARGE